MLLPAVHRLVSGSSPTSSGKLGQFQFLRCTVRYDNFLTSTQQEMLVVSFYGRQIGYLSQLTSGSWHWLSVLAFSLVSIRPVPLPHSGFLCTGIPMGNSPFFHHFPHSPWSWQCFPVIFLLIHINLTHFHSPVCMKFRLCSLNMKHTSLFWFHVFRGFSPLLLGLCWGSIPWWEHVMEKDLSIPGWKQQAELSDQDHTVFAKVTAPNLIPERWLIKVLILKKIFVKVLLPPSSMMLKTKMMLKTTWVFGGR